MKVRFVLIAALAAVIAYLKTLPPADMTIKPSRSIGPIGRFVYLTQGFPLLPATMISPDLERTVVAPGPTAEDAAYLEGRHDGRAEGKRIRLDFGLMLAVGIRIRIGAELDEREIGCGR